MKLMTQKYIVEMDVDWIPDVEGQEIQAAALGREIENALRPVAVGLPFSVKSLPVEEVSWYKFLADGSRVSMIDKAWWAFNPPRGQMIFPGPAFP